MPPRLQLSGEVGMGFGYFEVLGELRGFINLDCKDDQLSQSTIPDRIAGHQFPCRDPALTDREQRMCCGNAHPGRRTVAAFQC